MRKKDIEKELKRQGDWFADLIGEIIDHLNLEIKYHVKRDKGFSLVPKDKKENEHEAS